MTFSLPSQGPTIDPWQFIYSIATRVVFGREELAAHKRTRRRAGLDAITVVLESRTAAVASLACLQLRAVDRVYGHYAVRALEPGQAPRDRQGDCIRQARVRSKKPARSREASSKRVESTGPEILWPDCFGAGLVSY